MDLFHLVCWQPDIIAWRFPQPAASQLEPVHVIQLRMSINCDDKCQ